MGFDQRLQPTFAQTNCLEDGNVDGKLMESLLKIIAANWFVKGDFIGKPTTKLNSRDPRTILFKKKLLELVVGEGLVLAQTDQFIKSVTISIIVAVWHVSVASADYAIVITESGRTERSPAASPLKRKISSINFSQEQNVVQDSNQLHHLGRIVKKQEEQLVYLGMQSHTWHITIHGEQHVPKDVSEVLETIVSILTDKLVVMQRATTESCVNLRTKCYKLINVTNLLGDQGCMFLCSP